MLGHIPKAAEQIAPSIYPGLLMHVSAYRRETRYALGFMRGLPQKVAIEQELSLPRGDNGGVGDPQQPLEGTPRLCSTALGDTGGDEGLLSLGSCPEAARFCQASSSSASMPRLQE